MIYSGYVVRFGVTRELGYDVDGNEVLEDFEVEGIIRSYYNSNENKVWYLIK